MEVSVGDRVQIRNGGIDVTNGQRARAGSYYGEGGPWHCTVSGIVENWSTGGRWGLPGTVTKVRCENQGVIVWQVRKEDLTNVIRASKPEQIQTKPKAKKKDKVKEEVEKKVPKAKEKKKKKEVTVHANIEDVEDPDQVTSTSNKQIAGTSAATYAIKRESGTWKNMNQETTSPANGEALPLGIDLYQSEYLNHAMATNDYGGYVDNAWYERVHRKQLSGAEKQQSLRSKKVKYINKLYKDEGEYLVKMDYPSAWQDLNKQEQLLRRDYAYEMNAYGYPIPLNNPNDPKQKEEIMKLESRDQAMHYDYRVIPGDTRLPYITSLENKLMQARAAYGIPVHGNNLIARAMKYYMYNRFRVPDTNLAHNKTFTYIFFTRPDLNLLTNPNSGGKMEANQQIMNHSECAMTYRRYPDLLKLLTDNTRCRDSNNFNFLLSNQVMSFDLVDDTLNTMDAGKSWRESAVSYGVEYSGRTPNEFSCRFTEVSDYSVSTLIKLWITYIDNVSSGVWSPSYDLIGNKTVNTSSEEASHVYTKTLDYGASAYVFKCGPDGEDVLYWTKYYGIFPINTGVSAFSWDNDTPVGTPPALNIRFRYSAKRDMSPVSLIEFNHNANIGMGINTGLYLPSFNPNYGHTSRPFVGTPFIELKLAEPKLRSNGLDFSAEETQIRLKFKKVSDPALTDSLLYSYNPSLMLSQA